MWEIFRNHVLALTYLNCGRCSLLLTIYNILLKGFLLRSTVFFSFLGLRLVNWGLLDSFFQLLTTLNKLIIEASNFLLWHNIQIFLCHISDLF